MESREGYMPNGNNPENIRNKTERLERAQKAFRELVDEVLEGAG